jgi:LPS export ABC transporter permease LptF
MRITTKYLLRELVFPFFLALGIISFLLVANKLLTLVDLMLKYKVNPFVVAKLVAYLLPATFAITIPMSLLVAILLAFGRLASDMELTALKAGGVGLPRLFRPVLVLGLIFSMGMLGFNEFVLPRANLGYKVLFYDILRSRTNLVVQEGTYVRDFEGLVFHAGHKDPLSGELKDVTLFLLPKGSTPLQIVTARSGRLVSDSKSYRVYLQLNDGCVQSAGGQDPNAFTQMAFNTSVVDVDIQGGLKQVQGVDRKPQEMPVAEIIQHLKAMPDNSPDKAGWATEMHKKIAIPFACLVFAMAGCPLGAMSRRGGRLLSFIWALAIIFFYYVLLSLGETWGYRGSMPPWLGMWLPNLLLAVLALWLNWVAIKERPLFSRFLRPRIIIPKE